MSKAARNVFIGISVGFLALIILFLYLGTDHTTIAIVSALFSIIILAVSILLSEKKKK